MTTVTVRGVVTDRNEYNQWIGLGEFWAPENDVTVGEPYVGETVELTYTGTVTDSFSNGRVILEDRRGGTVNFEPGSDYTIDIQD